MERLNELQAEAVVLLEKLVATPSVSRDEARTADLLTGHLAAHGIAAPAERVVRISDGHIIYDGDREGAFL